MIWRTRKEAKSIKELNEKIEEIWREIERQDDRIRDVKDRITSVNYRSTCYTAHNGDYVSAADAIEAICKHFNIFINPARTDVKSRNEEQ